MRFDADACRKFLGYVMPPGTCIEMRIFKSQFARGGTGYIERSQFSTTLAGWYDQIDTLAVDAGRLRGVSGYIIPNPADHSFLASADNKLRKLDKGEGTHDTNISALRFLYIDFDPTKPGKEMSSSDSELAATVEARARMFNDFPEFQDHGLWGCSGNGSWALVRLPDYPNDGPCSEIIRRSIAYLSEHYGADARTKNAARLMPLVGTYKCKGEDQPKRGRPWRLVTLDGVGKSADVGLDLGSWVSRNVPAPQEGASRPVGVPFDPNRELVAAVRTERYAAAALEKEYAAVAGASEGERNTELNRAACALGEFVAAGHLDRTAVETALLAAGEAAGLDVHEIQATVCSGLEHGLGCPRHIAQTVDMLAAPATTTPALPPPSSGGQPGTDLDLSVPYGQEDNPHRLARGFLYEFCSHADGLKLAFWQDQFHLWSDHHYRPQSERKMRAQIAESVADDFSRQYAQALIATKGDPEAKLPALRNVSTKLVGDVIQAITGITLADVPAQPSWLHEAGDWPAIESVPMKNGILHLRSFLAGKPAMRPPTPRFFAAHSLQYPFDPHAPDPVQWYRFLKQIWPDDQDSINTLQEWFGLMLVPDISYQKILGLIGPPRAGKGVICNIMQALAGYDNCKSIRLSLMDKLHSLQGVIGKLCMIIPDGRMSSKVDQTAILEAILSISGGDPISIPRMYREAWNGKLSARITIVSNEMPRFHDTANALGDRLVVLRFVNTFTDTQDPDLEYKLLTELPGIFLWAVEGWKRLKERRGFIQPESGAEDMATLKEVSSPVSGFLADRCVVQQEENVSCAALFSAWRSWCEEQNQQPGTGAIFGRNLHAVIPTLTTKKRRIGGASGTFERYFTGVGLMEPSAAAFGISPGGPAGEPGEMVFTDEGGTPF